MSKNTSQMRSAAHNCRNLSNGPIQPFVLGHFKTSVNQTLLDLKVANSKETHFCFNRPSHRKLSTIAYYMLKRAILNYCILMGTGACQLVVINSNV